MGHTQKLTLCTVLGALLSHGAIAGSPLDLGKSDAIPGKLTSGACLPYATELHRRLTAQGVRAYLLHFKWTGPDERGLPSYGWHVCVLFQDPKDDRWYIADNERWATTWVRGMDLNQVVHQRYPNRELSYVKIVKYPSEVK